MSVAAMVNHCGLLRHSTMVWIFSKFDVFDFFTAFCKDMDDRTCGLILVYQIGALIFLSFHLVDCLFVSVAAMVNHRGLLCH
jgi:hypothetical protein